MGYMSMLDEMRCEGSVQIRDDMSEVVPRDLLLLYLRLEHLHGLRSLFLHGQVGPLHAVM